MRGTPLALVLLAGHAWSAVVDEFKVKREEVFAFAAKPIVTRQGNEFQIAFESKGACDVTVAIEDASGKIVRHLVSGVLGANAPAPLAKNSLKQAVTWDCKNDQGKVITDVDAMKVRVSLGLKPSFEKNLFHSPYKRVGDSAPLLQACPEGMLVYEGNTHDSVKLFDHDGKYVRTVYPFPADQVAKVDGLDWSDFPPGLHYPLKKGTYQQTLLTSGDNGEIAKTNDSAASAVAFRDGLIILAKRRLNRFCIDGTTGAYRLNGAQKARPGKAELWKDIPQDPVTNIELTDIFMTNTGSFHNKIRAYPSSAAISPDGKWLYLAGYSWRYFGNDDTMHAVMRMPVDGSEPMKIFAGRIDASADGFVRGAGAAPGEFNGAAAIDCDKSGRVYVADYMNDRVQVFDADGKHLKDIAVQKPSQVRIHRRTDEIFVFSSAIASQAHIQHYINIERDKRQYIKTGLNRFGTFDDATLKAFYDLPLLSAPFFTQDMASGLYCSLELDSWSDALTVWVGPEAINNGWQIHPANGGRTTPYEAAGIKVMREKEGKFELIEDFAKRVSESGVRAGAAIHDIQRMEVNPVTGKLYLAEVDSGPTLKTEKCLVEIDPETGAMKIIELPFNCLEYAFDLDGAIYLRSTGCIARYEFPSFREIPWDYGEETSDLGADAPILAKVSAAQSVLRMPCMPPVCFHQGGFGISPFGDIVASCAYRYVGISGRKSEMMSGEQAARMSTGKPYMPPMHPGREMNPTSACLQVFDKYGKWTRADAFPGMSQADGVRIDREGNLYLMHTPSRIVDGKQFFNEYSSTVMKVRPNAAKAYTSSQAVPIPLAPQQMPERPGDLVRGGESIWVDGAEWFYGGAGYAGFNTSENGGGCACIFSRFDLDLFARSIVPEPYQFAVGVVDSNGNLILRIGGYGNLDSAGPKSLVPRGGDEVGLFEPLFVAAHTDHRIFISDVGNGRIVSVKLDYNTSEIVALSGVRND